MCHQHHPKQGRKEKQSAEGKKKMYFSPCYSAAIPFHIIANQQQNYPAEALK